MSFNPGVPGRPGAQARPPAAAASSQALPDPRANLSAPGAIPDANALVTQVTLEALVAGPATARLTQVVVEVLTPAYSSAAGYTYAMIV